MNSTDRSESKLFAAVDANSDPQFFVDFLDLVRSLPSMQRIDFEISERIREIDPKIVVEIGCGTGDLLHQLVTGVCPQARGVGVEKSTFLTDVARRRHGTSAKLDFLVHDFTSPIVPDEIWSRFGGLGNTDAIIINRVAQHLMDPVCLIANAKALLREGGRIILSDVDWTRLEITHPDQDTTGQIIASHVNAMVNPTIGSTLCGLLSEAGLSKPITTFEIQHEFIDYQRSDQLLSFSRSIKRLCASGDLTPARAASWVAKCREMHSQSQFSARLYQAIAIADKFEENARTA
jgi:SAM-dependent methyltransferase